MPRKFNRKPPPRRRRPKFKKRKPAYKKHKFSGPKLQVSREVKFIETAIDTVELIERTASSTQMENGALMYPAGFNDDTTHINQGVGCDQLLGCFIRPLYCSQKFNISWANLDFSHADTNKGLRLRCRSGWIRNTGQKSGAITSSSATAWQEALHIMVAKELQDADLDSDYLTYRQRSRNIMIVKDSFIKPNLNKNMANTVATAVVTAASAAEVSFHKQYAPEVNFTINWDRTKGFPRQKTRLVPTGNSPTALVLNNHWVPFVYWSCDLLTANTGNIKIRSSSRYYFTDA